MAGRNEQLKVTLNFTADTEAAKRSINNLQSSLRNIHTQKIEVIDDVQFKNATKAAQELQRHLQNSVNVDTGKIDLTRFSQSLKQSNQNLEYFKTNFMAMGEAGEKAFLNLAQSISMSDAGMVRIGRRLDNFLTTLKNTAKWQISSNLMHGLEGMLSSAYGYAQDLNKSLNDIRIVSEKSTDQMASFAKEANKAAKALSTSTLNYSDAALIYYQQGLNEEAIAERTEITIKMANAAGVSAETASNQLTAVWNNFYDGSKSLEYYADVMTALGAATASSTDEISTGLEKFAASAESVGLSYEYATTALATVTAETRQSADVVGTAFKTLFTRIQGLNLGETQDDGTTLNKYSEALQKVGVEIKDSSGQLKSMDTILNDLGARWGDLSDDTKVAVAQAVGGARQYTQLMALMDNWDTFQKNLSVTSDSEGTLSAQAEIYAESWEAASKRVQASAEKIYSKLIDDEFMIDILDGFSTFLDRISDVIDGLGGVKGMLLAIATIVTRRYAKEIPNVLSNIASNIGLRTGKAKAEAERLQKENSEQLKQIANNSSFSVDIRTRAEGIDRLNQMNQELASKWEYLSEAERNAFQEKINIVQMLNDSVVRTAKEIEEITRTVNSLQTQLELRLSGNQEKSNALKSYNDDQRKLSTYSIEIEQARKQFAIWGENPEYAEKKKEYLKKMQERLENSEEKSKSLGGDNSEQVRKIFKDYSNDIDGLLTQLIANRVIELKNNMTKQVNTMTDNGADSETAEILADYGTNLGISSDMAAEKIHAEEVLKLLSGESAEHVTKASEVYGYFTSVVTQTMFAFQSFTNTMKVFKDETATAEQKFTALTSALASVGSFTTSIFSTNNLKHLGVMAQGLAKNKELSDEESAALKTLATDGVRAKGALSGLAKTIGPLLLKLGIAAAVVAAVGLAVNALVLSITKEKRAAESAEKAHARSKETYRELKEEINKVNDSLKNYESSLKTINSLTKGTYEWREQVSALNVEMLDLVEKYGFLRDYITNEGGVLTLSDKGKVLLNKQLEEDLINAEQEIYTTGMAKAALSNEQIYAKNYSTVSNLTYQTGDGQYQTVSQSFYTTEQDLKNIYDTINKMGLTQFDLNDSETIAKLFGLTEETDKNTALIKIIQENSKNLLENAKAIQSNNEELKLNTSSLGNTYLTDKEREKDYANSLGNSLGRKINELVEQELNSDEGIGQYNRAQTLSALRELNSDKYQEVKRAVGQDKIKYVDENGDQQTMSYDEARYILAYNKIEESLNDTTSALSVFKNGLLTFFNENGSLTKNKELDSFLYNDTDGLENGIDFSKATDEQLRQYQNFNGTINDRDANTVFGVESGTEVVTAIITSAVEEILRRQREEEFSRNNFYDQYYSKLDPEDQKKFWTDIDDSTVDYGTFADFSIASVYRTLKENGVDPEEFFDRVDLSKGLPNVNDDKAWNEIVERIIEEIQLEEKALAKSSELDVKIEDLKLDKDEVKSYTKHLQEMAEASDDLADSLKKDAIAAEEIAIAGMRLNRGLDEVQENFLEWEKILNSGDISSSEYAKAIEEYRNSMADILDIDAENITEDFLIKNKELVKSAAQGNAEAIEKMRLAWMEFEAEKIAVEFEIKGEQAGTQLLVGLNLIQTFLTENPLKVGAEVDESKLINIFNDLITNTELVAADIQKILGSAFTLNLDGDNKIKSLIYKGDASNLLSYSNTAAGGAQLKGAKDLEDKKKKLDEELDKYHEIKEVLEDINREQDRLGKEKDRAWGGKRIALIQKEIDKTKEAIAAQEEYLHQIEAQASASKGSIAAYGATFDEYGRITNYSELIAQQIALYNAAIASGVDSQIEAAEKAYEAFKKALSDYEEATDLLEEEYENLIDKQNELYDKMLEKVEYTVEIKLEVSERDQAYLDYLLEKKSNNAYDTAESIALIGDKTQDLINDGNTYREGIAAIFGNHGKDEDFIQQWLAGKISNEDLLKLGFTEQEIALLQQYADGLLDINTQLMELKNTITEMIMSAFQNLSEEMQKNIDVIDHLKSVMTSYKDIIDLVGKQNLGINSKFMNDINQTIFNTSTESLRANKAKLDATKEAYKSVQEMAETANAKWQEAQANSENYTETELDELEATAAAFNQTLDEMTSEVQEAEQAFLDSWQEALQAAADMFNQAVEDIVTDFEKAMSAGFGSLDSLLQVYEQTKTISSQYLEEYKQIYELSKLTRNINNSIDDTDNILGKEKLRDLLSEIEEMQRNGVEMSEYDLEYLQKRYELRLAEIALEDAQNAKSNVRMTRDAEGNWSYTYTSDDSTVDNARQNYEDKLYALQELSSEYLDTIGQQWIQAEKEWAQALQTIYQDTMLTEEERKNRIDQTNEFYKQRFDYFTEEIEKATGNNQKLYERDWAAYSKKTGYQISDNEKFQMSFNDTILGTIYSGVGSVQELHQILNNAIGAPGIEGTLLGDLDLSYKQWSTNVNLAMGAAGTSVEDFAGAVEDMADTVATDGDKAADDVEDQGQRVKDTFDGIKTAITNWITTYAEKIAAAVEENEKLVESIQQIAKAYLAALEAQNNFNNPGANTGGGGGGGNPSDTTTKPNPGNNKYKVTINGNPSTSEVKISVGRTSSYTKGIGTNSVTVEAGTLVTYTVSCDGYEPVTKQIAANSNYSDTVNLKKKGSSAPLPNPTSDTTLVPYDTGGYTGSWGSSGRLAMLHEKELVLNKADTKNMLQTVDLVREITKSIDLNAVYASQGLGALTAQTMSRESQILEQTVTIHAEFPNAVNHNEIEEAFNTLINTSSQYANRKSR